jgi:hypothetical protein
MANEAIPHLRPDDGEDLLPAQEAELRSLRLAPELPDALEDRVVRALARDGRIRRRVSWLRAVAYAAAAVLLSASGWMVGRTFPGPPAHTVGSRFLILLQAGGLNADQNPPHGSAEEALRVDEYIAWVHGLRSQGHLVQGERLADLGRELGPDGSHDAQWTLTAGAVQGFFVVSAPDLTRAVELARGCPHLRHGGRIEVRPIDTP